MYCALIYVGCIGSSHGKASTIKEAVALAARIAKKHWRLPPQTVTAHVFRPPVEWYTATPGVIMNPVTGKQVEIVKRVQVEIK